jgi:hypothetical protein
MVPSSFYYLRMPRLGRIDDAATAIQAFAPMSSSRFRSAAAASAAAGPRRIQRAHELRGNEHEQLGLLRPLGLAAEQMPDNRQP